MLIQINNLHLVEAELNLPEPQVGDQVTVIDIHSILESPQSETAVSRWLLGNEYTVSDIMQAPMGPTFILN